MPHQVILSFTGVAVVALAEVPGLALSEEFLSLPLFEQAPNSKEVVMKTERTMELLLFIR
ncbi:hypothetical protein D3C81_2155430 [compost metagenome]